MKWVHEIIGEYQAQKTQGNVFLFPNVRRNIYANLQFHGEGVPEMTDNRDH